MQPNKVRLNNVDYRVFERDGINYPVEPIPVYALYRIFNLQRNRSKSINFKDLKGVWKLESIYISSPENSGLGLNILYQGTSLFYARYKKEETPIQMPTVTVSNELTLQATCFDKNITGVFIYLRPAYLELVKDF